MDLVEVLRLCGRPEDADGALDQARELYERKGSLVGIRRVGAAERSTRSD